MPGAEVQPNGRRYRVLLGLFLGSLVILLAQLIQLQLLRGSYYRRVAARQSLRMVWVPALRGRIYDRHMQVLADNRPAFDIEVSPTELSGRQQTNVVRALAALLQQPAEVLWSNLQPHRYFAYQPARVARDITHRQMLRVAERLHALPAVEVVVNPLRRYPHGAACGHVLGYVSSVPPDHPRLKSGEYSLNDVVGASGIERVCEEYLHGVNGKKLVQVDRRSRYVETKEVRPPIPGHDVILTIDATLQSVLAEALSNRVGAAVALDPRTGEVLAMVSSPGFDPNLFVGGISPAVFAALREDPLRPLLNRAIAGQYQLGSAFKPITAIAGIENDLITSTTVYYDISGYFDYGAQRWYNFRRLRQGMLTLPEALRVSCNTFFCYFAPQIGVARLAMYARLFGLGDRTGIELPGEAAGLVPDAGWKRQRMHEPWYPGDTINFAIGQGYLLVTPLQVACMTAVIANRGTWYPPRIIRAYVINRQTVLARSTRAPVPVPVSQEAFALVRRGLWEVVNTRNGSGRLAYLERPVVAGKTGSAMVGPVTYGWFTGYAPADEPALVVTVLVEGAETGGRDAAPIARRAFAAYFDVDLLSLTNVPHNVTIID
ncbi:MAG: penicillin-binding protein 2 [bacterium]|nr:penicillin-binding protein 2 [bacterium]